MTSVMIKKKLYNILGYHQKGLLYIFFEPFTNKNRIPAVQRAKEIKDKKVVVELCTRVKYQELLTVVKVSLRLFKEEGFI